MTTLRDILYDLLTDSLEKVEVAEGGVTVLSMDSRDELVDEYIDLIKERMIG